MSKKQTEKSPYPSKYNPGTFITPAQYILEQVCERKANFDKEALPVKFWNIPAWNTFYKKNLRQVHKLIKLYGNKAVVAAIQDEKMKNRYSIFTPFFLDLVTTHKDILKSQELVQEVRRAQQPTRPRPEKTSNLLDTLEEIDG